jgi:hypothetical protein
MKKSGLSGFLCLALLLSCLVGQAHGGFKFGFRIYGGPNYMEGGDLQKALKGSGDYLYAQYSPWFIGTGSYKPFHLGPNFGGEILLQFNRYLAIGLGGEYLQASSDTTYNYTTPGLPFQVYMKPKVSAMPLTFSLLLTLPVGGRLNIILHGGVGYYMAKLKLDDQSWYVHDIQGQYDTKASGLGYHAGLGLEIVLSRGVGFLLEVRGRYAIITGFKGNGTTRIPAESYSSTSSGKFYYYRRTWPTVGVYDLYGFGTSTPSGPYISDARELRVDFSGANIVIGFVFRL